MKIFEKLFSVAVMIAAAAFAATSCSSDDTEEGTNSSSDDLSTLKVAFGSDQYNVEPGGTISLEFVVTGHDNVDIDVTASASSDKASVSVSNPLVYQGQVSFTAPAVSDGETITVTLTASDSKNSRTASTTTEIVVSSSETLAITFASEYRSITCKSGASFSIPFTVTGVGSAVLSTPEVTVSPTSWTATCTMSSTTAGTVQVTAPASLTSSVTITISVSDDFNRTASVELNLTVVEATTAEGAANSYIVAPGGKVTINAVEGNSTDKLTFDNAVLVWQTAVGLVQTVSADPDENLVVVQLGSGSGNAVVAAVNEGTIVWSWHLWVTDYDPEDDPFVWTSTSTNTTYTYMDRNLGALSAEKYSADALGLFYQFGRKDPFTGPNGTTSVVAVVKYDMDGNVIEDEIMERPTPASSSETNLQFAIENPDVFLVAATSVWPVRDWLTDVAAGQNNDLWGGTSLIKTKYDPCPEGWRVPYVGDSWGFRSEYSKSGSLTDSSKYDSDYPWYCEYDDEYCIGFRYKTTDGKEYWFPFAGHRDMDTGSIASTGGGADFWTASVSSTTAYVEILAWGNPASETGLNRPYGNSVRCIKDN